MCVCVLFGLFWSSRLNSLGFQHTVYSNVVYGDLTINSPTVLSEKTLIWLNMNLPGVKFKGINDISVLFLKLQLVKF